MRRTPLVAAGFLVGAVLGALPPVQTLTAELHCTGRGGRWLAHADACELRGGRARVSPGDARRSLPVPE